MVHADAGEWQPIREQQLSVPPIAEDLPKEPHAGQTVRVSGAGEVAVSVEWIPGNARRIYASLDIPASVDAVWQVMTDYAGLPDVIPNLTECDVLEYYPEDGGATMWQVGRAQLKLPGTRAGLSFEAGSTLRVSLHPEGLPTAMLHRAGGSLGGGAPDPLVPGVFPQPPERMTVGCEVGVREITMRWEEGAKGDFRHYQGLWRLEPVQLDDGPGMRLSYASEVAPHWFMPVAPVEGQIAEALGENLEAIRDHVTGARAPN